MSSGPVFKLLHGANRIAPRLVIGAALPDGLRHVRGDAMRRTLGAVHAVHSVRALPPGPPPAARDPAFGIALVCLATELLRRSGIDRERFGREETPKGKPPYFWMEAYRKDVALTALEQANGLLKRAEAKADDAALSDHAAAAVDAVLDTCFGDPANAYVESENLVYCMADLAGYVFRPVHPVLGWRQFGFGARAVRSERNHFEIESSIGNRIQKNKYATSLILHQAGISVPENRLATSFEEAKQAVAQIGYPVVTKPFDGSLNLGVSAMIETEEELRAGCAYAQTDPKRPSIVERHIEGVLHRFMVVHHRMIDVFSRESGVITGDGKRSIREILDAMNDGILHGTSQRTPLDWVNAAKIDGAVSVPYRKMGYTLDSVPKSGEQVRTSYFGATFTGGVSERVTGRVHPGFAAVCERATRSLGLEIAGLDIIVKDITAPPTPENYAVNEANAWASLTFYNRGDPSMPGAADLLRNLLGPPDSLRVPVVLVVTGAAEASPDIAPALTRVLGSSGAKVACACRSGYWLGEWRLRAGNHANLAGFETALSDRQAEVIVTERPAGDLARRGLGIDRVDLVVHATPPEIGAKRLAAAVGFLEASAPLGVLRYDGAPDFAETVAARLRNAGLLSKRL